MNTSSAQSLSSNKFLPSSSESGPFLYIFMHVMGSNDYILYRIDALKHLDNKPSSTNTRRPYNLRPLLVFLEPVLPEECVCAKLGSTFYFFGGCYRQPSFGGKHSEGRDVYMIRESDLMDLVPSQRNTDGKRYLIRSASMHGGKHHATVFVAENKLYVLSWLASDAQFEVFCPRVGAWRVLPSRPDGYDNDMVTCYVVVDKTVYFELCEEAVLSFHLGKEKWGIMTKYQDNPPVFPTHSFASMGPLVVTGGLAFGCVYDENDCDDDWDDSLTICATPLPRHGNSMSHEFMRPLIPLGGKLLDALNHKRCPHVTNKYYENFSDYIVALDGGQVLCVISYGSGPVTLPKDSWQIVDPYTGYVTLTYFEVTPKASASNDGYVNEKADGKCVARRCFEAKLLHSTQFIIKTASLRTCGRIQACLSEGL